MWIKNHLDNILKYESFKECKNAGIFCYLMDSSTNQYYNVGHHRIYNLDLRIK